LAITPSSFTSFADTHFGDRKGDYRGFLHVLDAKYFPPTIPPINKATHPLDDLSTSTPPAGYSGTFKIIDQLLWTDLFATSFLTGSGTLLAQEYWALSQQHPLGVYVGPTTGVQRRDWREMREA
jgi:hypothetical protein